MPDGKPPAGDVVVVATSSARTVCVTMPEPCVPLLTLPIRKPSAADASDSIALDQSGGNFASTPKNDCVMTEMKPMPIYANTMIDAIKTPATSLPWFNITNPCRFFLYKNAATHDGAAAFFVIEMLYPRAMI